ncbi:putative protein phosphatase 2C 50 [Camellia lanceoleosa]|uniref:Uncharacterized protein n=1 Tax=Camellia lanceoleosa TaxID=1840588 RepID=A0ACC0FSV9_9ERIC|nr:putative protein phosphatase 2C 50 [Camellia lanceoleosa]
MHMEILKALVRTIHDIDTTFSKEASENNLVSGSTATVVLLVDGHILAAHVGDSKAVLCSEKFYTPDEVQGRILTPVHKASHYPKFQEPQYDHCASQANQQTATLFVIFPESTKQMIIV